MNPKAKFVVSCIELEQQFFIVHIFQTSTSLDSQYSHLKKGLSHITFILLLCQCITLRDSRHPLESSTALHLNKSISIYSLDFTNSSQHEIPQYHASVNNKKTDSQVIYIRRDVKPNDFGTLQLTQGNTHTHVIIS